jgi:TrmH family RNA methyltransferase
MNFENLRVILVETTHPGNIGATARAMKNMGLSRLALVRPSRFPHAEATARAAGADDILAKTRIVDNLEEALSDCQLVMGASARRRGLSGPELDPRQCAEQVAKSGPHVEIALVFGRESSGLTNDEMDRCHFLVRIPTDPAFGSLNLAAAVLVLAYELRMMAHSVRPVCLSETGKFPASAEEMAHFYEHLERVLLATGFLNPASPRHLMRRLRRLFNRAKPDQHEIKILRGILSSVQGRKRLSR